jgi:hypothetical protein
VRKPNLHLSCRALTRRVITVSAMSIAFVSLAAAPAWSAVSSEQQGAALLAQMQNGQTTCGQLSSGNLVLVGEYSMGRIMGSTAAQNAMNAQMLATTGARGEQSAYQFMGRRLGGCASGNGPVAFGAMMGLMGTSEMGASYGSAYSAGGYGSSMMGRYGSSHTAGSDGTSGAVIVALVLGGLVMLALIAVLATRRPPRRPTQPRAA